VRDGVATGASTRNLASYGSALRMAEAAREWQRKLLTDPQTSGGLLIACAPDTVDAVMAAVRAEQGDSARVIGHMEAGEPLLRIG